MLPDLDASRSRSALHQCIVGKVSCMAGVHRSPHRVCCAAVAVTLGPGIYHRSSSLEKRHKSSEQEADDDTII